MNHEVFQSACVKLRKQLLGSVDLTQECIEHVKLFDPSEDGRGFINSCWEIMEMRSRYHQFMVDAIIAKIAWLYSNGRINAYQKICRILYV
jgi:hypothetical protein